MPQPHKISLLVTPERTILSTPDCKNLPIFVGDSLHFHCDHDFQINFPQSVFHKDNASSNEPILEVTKAGVFSGICTVTPKGEKPITAGNGVAYGLDGQSQSGDGGIKG